MKKLFTFLFLFMSVIGFSQTLKLNNNTVTISNTGAVTALSVSATTRKSTFDSVLVNKKLGINSTNFIHSLSVVSNATIGRNAVNFVDGSKNINRTSLAQAIDTSSISFSFTPLSKPEIKINNNIGTSNLYLDSTGNLTTIGKLTTSFIVASSRKSTFDSILVNKKLGINSTNFIHSLSVVSDAVIGRNAVNFVDGSKNKNRTSVAQATDTSSTSFSFSPLGKPLININGATGVSVLKLDSVGTLTVAGSISANSITATTGNSLVHSYTVGSGTCKFATIADAKTWLSTPGNMTSNSELLLDGGTHYISDSIGWQLPYSLTIRGMGFEATTIAATTGLTGKPMFNIRSTVFFEGITFDGSTLASYGTLTNENCINLIGNDLLIYINNYKITGFKKGINITGGSDVICISGILENCYAGIESNSTDTTSLDIETSNIVSCVRGVNLVKGVYSDFFITNVIFYNTANDTAVYYDGTNYTYNGISNITGCTWNFLGKFLIGFDFTNTRDANIFVKNNVGVEDKNPHAKINVINNGTTTTVTTTTNYYKVNWTNGTTYTCKFTLADNRFTYQPIKENDIKIWVSGNVQVNQNTRVVDLAIVKNAGCGTSPVLVNNACLYSPMSCRLQSQNVPYSFSLVAYIPSVQLNDYIELWCTSSSSGDVVIVQDVTIYVEAN